MALQISEQIAKADKQLLSRIENLPYYCATERVKAVLEGRSKRRKGFTQDEVATLFMFDYECESGTGNFYSEMGILTHYRTVEAIKTYNSEIISNRDCWSRGFARCSPPPLTDYRLNLTLIGNAVRTQQDLRTIEIIDHVEESQQNRPATLLTVALEYYKGEWDSAKAEEVKETYREKRYLLNAFDDSGAFVAELKKPCTNVKEAFESMKPKIVKLAQAIGLEVKRQGELFFIPTDVKTSQVVDLQKRTKEECVYVYFVCRKCGIQHKATCTWEEKDDTVIHPSFYWSAPPHVTEQQANCDGKSEDMEKRLRLGFKYSPYPQIGDKNHTATRLGTYVETRGIGKGLNIISK